MTTGDLLVEARRVYCEKTGLTRIFSPLEHLVGFEILEPKGTTRADGYVRHGVIAYSMLHGWYQAGADPQALVDMIAQAGK